MSAQPTSAYEAWVRRLRTWSRDPTTPLHDLPVLRHDTFTAETYNRLLTHLEKALGAVGDRWAEGLTRAFSQVQSNHEFARELVNLRAVLARRLQLASHPHLPPALRDPLTRETLRSFEDLQKELEEQISALSRENHVPQQQVELLLRVVKDNPLSRIVDMDIPLDGSTPAAPVAERAT